VKIGPARDGSPAFWAIALLLALVVSIWAFPLKASEAQRPGSDAIAKGSALLIASGAPPAGEYRRYPELDRLASTFAMRTAHMRCPTPDAWASNPLSLFVWAYTTLGWNYAIVDPSLCDAALSVARGISESQEPWRIGVAVSTIVHESYHLRRQWSLRGNEAAVQCKAIRHFTVAMRMLGADEELVEATKGWALMDHWRIARLADEYYLPDCGVPKPW